MQKLRPVFRTEFLSVQPLFSFYMAKYAAVFPVISLRTRF